MYNQQGDAMFFGIIIPLLILPATYGLVTLGLTVVFRKMQVPSKKAILVGFLVFGIAIGFFAAWLWPADSSVYFNAFGALLGDQGISKQKIGQIPICSGASARNHYI